MRYPIKKFIYEALSAAAESAINDSDAVHPEDLAIAAITAIEHTANTITYLNDIGLLKDEAYE